MDDYMSRMALEKDDFRRFSGRGARCIKVGNGTLNSDAEFQIYPKNGKLTHFYVFVYLDNLHVKLE